VKFGKYVTGSVVKVPEKFGFDWSIFGWFGHFTEHVVGGVLGFWGNGYLRWKTIPKELGTCKDTQGTQRNIYDHLVSLDFIGSWNWHTKGGALPHCLKK
jgi:hypothetical protein